MLDYLIDWAYQWPLSSVGMDLRRVEELSRVSTEQNDEPIEPENQNPEFKIQPILASEFLSRVYLDRIVACDDCSRIGPTAIKSRLASEVGLYPTMLGTKIRTALEADYQFDLPEKSNGNSDDTHEKV